MFIARSFNQSLAKKMFSITGITKRDDILTSNVSTVNKNITHHI